MEPSPMVGSDEMESSPKDGETISMDTLTDVLRYTQDNLLVSSPVEEGDGNSSLEGCLWRGSPLGKALNHRPHP